MRRTTVTAILVIVAPLMAQAQTTSTVGPRIELGVGLASGSWFGGESTGSMLDVRVTGRITRRWGVEFVSDFQMDELGFDNLSGLYVVQGTFLLHETGTRGLSVLATFGALGGFYRYSYPAGRYVAPDGEVWKWPAATAAEFSHPTEIVGGIAVQKVLARHIAVRGDAQVVVCAYGEGAGLRVAGGVSVPIGNYRTPGKH